MKQKIITFEMEIDECNTNVTYDICASRWLGFDSELNKLSFFMQIIPSIMQKIIYYLPSMPP